MITLQQRLRELSKEKFESLVHQMLLQKFPGAGIKRCDGTGGDEGIDSFSGDLSDGPAIWQCKHFPNRIRQPQKEQILESARTAFAFRAPQRWILCVPIDLRTKEHQWFETEVANKYKRRAKIELMTASEILHELVYNRPLRDMFFPDHAVSNALTIRQIALGTENASLDQKEKFAVEAAQQFLEGNLDLDPRLEPFVSVGLMRQPNYTRGFAGSVFSVNKGNMAVHYVPRNPTAYNLDPIQLQMTLSQEDSKNLNRAINTGLPFKLSAGAILKLDSESALLRHFFPSADLSQLQLEMRPGIPAKIAAKEFPMRFLTGPPKDPKELPYLPFKISQIGRKEITLTSCSRLPIEISIRLSAPPKQGAKITIRPLLPGANAIELVKIFEFLDTLAETGNLEVFSLDPPGSLFSELGKFSNRLKISAGLKAISEAALISKFFRVPLLIPDRITGQDLEAIQTLKRIATGEPLSQMNVSANLIKDSALLENVTKFLGGAPTAVRMENPTGWQNVRIFGQTIDTGSISVVADEVVVLDGKETLKRYLDASEGAAVDWKGTIRGVCRFVAAQNRSQENAQGKWTFTSEEKSNVSD
jgi:hypothetical protein